jgi:glycosyltransferase involved in cell wall biosynthesis
MRICYVLLSPTFGMHQYTADLANRLVADEAWLEAEVHLVTTTNLPADRYAPAVRIHTPLTTQNTGLSLDSLRLDKLARVKTTLRELRPDLVHFTGPHLWNVRLLRWLRRQGIPTIHTLHDLDPHAGGAYGWFLPRWNSEVIKAADQLLVHGDNYRRQLLGLGCRPEQVTLTPLLHLFLSHELIASLACQKNLPVTYEPYVLFFGRLERYKGIDTLLAAWLQNETYFAQQERFNLVLAGPGRLSAIWNVDLPAGVILRNRLIEDAEALDLFRRCSLVILPYVKATQSALVAAAYYFRKPVMVTYNGALPEYVEEGSTGFVVQPDHPPSLARALRTALADRGRLVDMGQAGRAWYDRERERETAALLNLYRHSLRGVVHGAISDR